MQEGVRRRRNGRGLMFLKCWRMLAVAAAVLALSGIVAGCGAVGGRKKQKPFDVQYLTYFDTVTSITIYAEDEEQFAKWEQLVHSELERYHQLYDIYHSYEGVNNIKVINDHAGISPVEVSEDILDLLEFSLKEYELTKGGVHVGMGSVLSIWHDYREMALGESKFPMVPSMDELESAAKHMNIQDIHLDRQAGTVFLADPEMRLDVGAVAKGYTAQSMDELESAAKHMNIQDIHLDRQAGTVFLADPEMRLDVGAVAKGYTAQRLADTLRKSGVTNALLSLGGNVVTIGARGDGKPWRVGIQNPDLGAENPYVQVVDLADMCLVTSGLGGNVVTIGARGDGKPWRVGIQNPDLGAENPYVQVVDLADMCLVTSGTYQRFYEVDGKRYHHIINPELLMPWNEYQSVTILSPDSGQRFYEVDGKRYHHIINPELLMPWNEYQSVTILSPDSGEADALSTAVFNMKLEDGLSLIESLDKTEALWILPDGSQIESSGFRAYTEEGR